jgi:hypothetical protein
MEGVFAHVCSLVNSGISVDVLGPWGPFAADGIIVTPKVKQATHRVFETSFNRKHRTIFPDLAGFVQKQKSKLFVNEAWVDIPGSRSETAGEGLPMN